jgi:uncharacterized protein (TIGR00304 family)
LDVGGKRVDLAVFYGFGIALVVVGIIIIVAAIIVASMGGAKKSKLHGAGVIMIGPIPIIFGTDKKSVKAVLALALALIIVVLIIIAVNYWLLR